MFPLIKQTFYEMNEIVKRWESYRSLVTLQITGATSWSHSSITKHKNKAFHSRQRLVIASGKLKQNKTWK